MSKNKSMWNKGVGLLLNTHDNANLAIILNELRLLALNRFKWSNLPQGLESRHIENALFEHGQCAFFERSEGGLCCLPCSPGNGYNVYGDPLAYTVTGIGYSELICADSAIRILNNDMGMPTSPMIYKYANLINEVEITQSRNLKHQRVPYVIPTTKDNELTVKNIYKKIDEGQEVIFTDAKLTNGGDIGVQVLNTEAKYIVNNLQEHKNNIINELLTKLGLNNSSANGSKRERLLVDEVNINNGQILMYLDVEYKNRLLAAEQINEKFGLNIKVEKVIDNLSLNFLGQEKEVGDEVE